MIRDLNTKPFACKANALPIELIIQFSTDLDRIQKFSAVMGDPLPLGLDRPYQGLEPKYEVFQFPSRTSKA